MASSTAQLITQHALEQVIQLARPRQWPELLCNIHKKQTDSPIKALIQTLGSDNKQLQASILHAIDQDNSAYLQLLHRCGVDFNALDTNSPLPCLVRAAHCGSPSAFQALFQIIKNPCAVTTFGDSIWHAIASSPAPSKKIINFLIKHHIKNNADSAHALAAQAFSKNNYDKTPVKLALEMNHPYAATLITNAINQLPSQLMEESIVDSNPRPVESTSLARSGFGLFESKSPSGSLSTSTSTSVSSISETSTHSNTKRPQSSSNSSVEPEPMTQLEITNIKRP